MKPFVEDGTSPVFGLWSVPDLGYLSYRSPPSSSAARSPARKARPSRSRASTATQPYTIGKDSVVILGPAFRFDKTNVDVIF